MTLLYEAIILNGLSLKHFYKMNSSSQRVILTESAKSEDSNDYCLSLTHNLSQMIQSVL